MVYFDTFTEYNTLVPTSAADFDINQHFKYKSLQMKTLIY